jgi:hypothetical protein
MKISYVLTSTTHNQMYYDFIPIFIKAWKKLFPEIKIVILYIHHEIPKKFEEYKEHLVLIKPILNTPVVFTSQYIRLLYPALVDTNRCVIITDMDMLPMNRQYYEKPIENIPNDRFVYYRSNVLLNEKQIAMCYNVATPQTWQQIFNIDSIEKLRYNIKQMWFFFQNKPTAKWSLDQKILYNILQKWNSKTKRVIFLNDKFTGYNRLDRQPKFFRNKELLLKQVKEGFYSDFHSLRPYKQYKTIIDDIINNL